VTVSQPALEDHLAERIVHKVVHFRWVVLASRRDRLMFPEVSWLQGTVPKLESNRYFLGRAVISLVGIVARQFCYVPGNYSHQKQTDLADDVVRRSAVRLKIVASRCRKYLS